MTKKHFIAAANLVNSIRQGEWCHTLPDWAPDAVQGQTPIECETEESGNLDTHIVRAVWTAEAFIILARAFNPRFDERRFLVACGLVDKPAKGRT